MNKTREPALLMGVCQATVGVLVAFGLPLSTRQIGAVLVGTAALLLLISRQLVRPVATSPTFVVGSSGSGSGSGAGPAAGGPWALTIDEKLAPRCTSGDAGLP